MNFLFSNLNIKRNARLHFIGIGGISMSALAKFCTLEGFCVSGSDKNFSGISSELINMGVKIYKGHFPENVLGKDAVIYTSAIDELNPELVYAKERGILVIKRAELLGEILRQAKYSIGVAGSHGKTTATSMITDVLTEAGLNPTAFIGGHHLKYGNFKYGLKNCVVAEACEYKKNFLYLKPSVPVVLNLDDDHLDSYKGMQDLERAFSEFIKGYISVVNADDERALKISDVLSVTFGIKNSATYTAREIRKNGLGYSFNLYKCNNKLGRIKLKIKGKHNIYNALAAAAVGDISGADFRQIKSALEKFSGVKRRNEFLGEIFSMPAICDYAHHPKEITAFSDNEVKREITVFQPHTYSRTEKLMDDFVKSLAEQRCVIIYKTYPAREKYSKKASAKALYKRLKRVRARDTYYSSNPLKLKLLLKKLSLRYNKVYFLGAGDIYDVCKNKLLDKKRALSF